VKSPIALVRPLLGVVKIRLAQVVNFRLAFARIEDSEHGNRIYLRINTFRIAAVLALLREAEIQPVV
jgi:hypothetical protein